MSAPSFRKQVWFEGRVQGVGFRYKAVELSKGYDVTGFVQNTDDGRVYLVACGDEDEVSDFVRALRDLMSDYIRDMRELDDLSELKYKGFKIEL